MKRKWEAIIAVIGGSLALIFFGGLAVTMQNISIADFKKSYHALKLDTMGTLESTYYLLQKMTGLFAVTLFISLVVLAVAIFLSIKERYWIIAAGLYLVSGLILLFGTQFIAFPFAFFHFIAAILTIYRMKEKKGTAIND